MSDGAEREYLAEVAAAVAEHRLGHFEEARAHFVIAHRLAPSARTLRGLGKLEFELRNYGESLRYLREALDSPVKPLDAEMRLEVERLAARARVYTGELHLELEPDSATVSVDGVVVARGPRASLALNIGEHLLEFQADGRLPVRRAVHVRSGEATSMQVILGAPTESLLGTMLAPAVDTTSNVASRSDSTLELPRRPNRALRIWCSVGAVAASALALGLALGLRREHRRETEPLYTSPNTPAGVGNSSGGTR